MTASIWLPKGEPGDKGPVGDKGPTGDKGPQGEPGEDSVDQQLRDILEDPQEAPAYIQFDPEASYLPNSLGSIIKQLMAGIPVIPGAAGDGIADDTIPVLTAIAASVEKGSFVFPKNKVYRITAQSNIDVPMEINLNGSHLKFDFDDSLANGVGFLVASDNVSIGRGKITVEGTLIGAASSAHVPIYGGREDTGNSWKNLSFKDLTLGTEGNGGIIFMGGTDNVDVENIVIEDSAGIRTAVGFEWGGTPEVGTQHPRNLRIKNIKAGRLTYPGEPDANHTCVVWVSSAFNVAMENIYADEVPSVVNVFTGDRSNLYAPEEYRDIIGTNITLDNAACAKVTGNGIRVYGKGTDSEIPLPESVKISGLFLKATENQVYTTRGLLLEYCEGVSIENFVLDGFHYGFATGADVIRPKLRHGVVRNCQYNGGRLGSADHPTIDPTVQDVLFHGNNKAETTGIDTATALLVTAVNDANIENNRFGILGETETQRYSIHCTSQSNRPRLENNRTNALATGGVSYVIGSQADTDINAHGSNNTSAGSILNNASGAPIFQIATNGDRTFVWDGIPTSGNFQQGDRCYFFSPTASGHIGAVCVTSGSPGTWKNFGAVAA